MVYKKIGKELWTNREITATVINTFKYGLYQADGGNSKKFKWIKMTFDETEKWPHTPSARPEASRRRPHFVPHPAPSPETHVV